MVAVVAAAVVVGNTAEGIAGGTGGIAGLDSVVVVVEGMPDAVVAHRLAVVVADVVVVVPGRRRPGNTCSVAVAAVVVVVAVASPGFGSAAAAG